MDSFCTQSSQCDNLAAHDKAKKKCNRESHETEIENETRLWVKWICRKRIASKKKQSANYYLKWCANQYCIDCCS